MDKQINVGILGAGSMGQRHAERLQALTGVNVTAICDSDGARATHLKDSLSGDATVFEDFDTMLQRAKLDALYVCLPPFAHHGEVEKAAARGLHLFLEKPIALTVEKGERMVAAIENAGVVSQVGFHLRWRKLSRSIKAAIDSGEAGRPTLFTGRFWCNMLGAAWWHDINGSGGQVTEQVIHIYDLALHFLGRPVSVSAFAGNLCHTAVSGYTIEDTSVAVVRFASGAMAAITGSNCALPDHYIGDWRLVCERAMAEFRSPGQEWIVPGESTLFKHGTAKLEREELVENGDAYNDEDIDFISAIRSGSAALTPARQGLDALRLVCAVKASAQQNGQLILL